MLMYNMLRCVGGSPYSHSPSGSIPQGYRPTGGEHHPSMCKTSGAGWTAEASPRARDEGVQPYRYKYANGKMLPKEFSSRIPGTRNEQKRKIVWFKGRGNSLIEFPGAQNHKRQKLGKSRVELVCDSEKRKLKRETQRQQRARGLSN